MSGGTGIRTPRMSPTGGGRGPAANWPGGWDGGGGGRGGDDEPSYGERLKRYRLGLMLALSSVVMLFVSFTTAYVVRKAGAVWDAAHNDFISNWVPLTLPLKILLINTAVLLLSSATLEVARRRAAQDVALAPISRIPGIRVDYNHALPWVWTTIVLGFGFLAGQLYAWRVLEQYNLGFATNAASSFFFILTGVHAVHLIGGILALLYAGITQWLHQPPERRRIVTRCDGVVLALHGRALAVHLRTAVLRAVSSRQPSASDVSWRFAYHFSLLAFGSSPERVSRVSMKSGDTPSFSFPAKPPC